MRIRRNRGNTLFVVLFFIVVLSVFAGAAFNYTSGTASAGLRSTQMTLGYGVADAAMELVYSRWRAIVASQTNKNLNAKVFIDPTSVYNNLGIDITNVTLSRLGLPPGYLGLPDTLYDFSSLSTSAGMITIRTVDVYGRLYGDYDTVGLRCNNASTKLIEATNRNGYNAVTNDYYPPPGSPADYTFLTAIGSANGFDAVNIIYEVQVQLNVPSRNGPITVNVKRHFTRSLANAAQAAIFFENRLELFPGSNMSVAGRVHTNDNLFQGTRLSAGTTLDFLKRVTYAGIDYNANASGTPSPGHDIVQLGYGTLDDSALDPAPVNRFPGNLSGSPDQVAAMMVGGIDRTFLQPFSLQNPSYNNNSLREIIERPVRQTGKSLLDPTTVDYNTYWDVATSTSDAAAAQAAIESARLYNQASIKVLLVYDPVTGLIDTAKTIIRATTPAGKADGPNVSTYDPALSTAILNALNVPADGSGTYLTRTRGLVSDAREAQRGTLNAIATTTIDVARLAAALEASTLTHFNGILYVADVTNQDADTLSYNNGMTVAANSNLKDYETTPDTRRLKHGIMLTNGAVLPFATIRTDLSDPERSFTVASENAVYIKGDYNTGGVGSTVPSNFTNTADGTNTYVAGYDPVTAAVMGDVISVVSRNFDPTKGYDDFFQPRRSTFDATKAAAIDPATGIEVAPGTAGSVTALSRQAVSTTVNTAVVSGIFQNNVTEAGGGASNLLRFMENWGQVPTGYSTDKDFYNPANGITTTKFTYKGSMMQSFFSREFTSPWSPPGLRQAYNAPVRDVQFDQSYITKPPQGFPKTITYVKGAWERF